MRDAAPVVHGGTDALGVPAHDFSTNRNACGPCPLALAALQAAHAAQYPDPAYTALRLRLGEFHGVEAARIVLAGSASEFIYRISAHAARQGLRQVVLPRHSYGDYAQAASVWGLEQGIGAPALHWACEPSSPLGQADAALAQWHAEAHDPSTVRPELVKGRFTHSGSNRSGSSLHVLDCAYQPLRLDGQASVIPSGVWQVWTPNKALGMTGVRAAYAIAPEAAALDVAALQALAPSWVVGAHGVAMLEAWTTPEVQQWLVHSRAQLAQWKTAQMALCVALGWQVAPGSLANYFVAHWPTALLGQLPQRLAWLRREHGIKLRDAASFGLAGAVRLGVLPPASQQALATGWRAAQSIEWAP